MTEENVVLLKKGLHDLNNRMGIILANAELLQMEALTPKSTERVRMIESKALEIRGIILQISSFCQE